MTACAKKETDYPKFNVIGHMQTDYAEKFMVEYCDDGCSLIDIDGEKFLLVPENADIPSYAENVEIIRQPVKNIYLAATSAMDLFDALGALDEVTMTSTDIDGWSLPNVQKAIQAGNLNYVGKYSTPDYEALTELDCGIAIESTMINHSPDTKEQLKLLGIPVLTEQSSYESHPMARLEWIKLYGLLIGKSEEAEKYFNEKKQEFEALTVNDISESEKKTAAFFYLSSNGYVNIRKPGDYISKMIELAGGKYIFTADGLNVDDNALSTMNIQLEEFYETAKDADIIIYNSTIEGELDDLDQFLNLSPVFADLRAVKEGNVWCTEKNMFQQTTGVSDMIADLELIFTGKADDKDDLTFLHRLK